MAAAGYSGTPLARKLGVEPSHRALGLALPELLAAREARTSLWIAWPKRSSGVASDLDDNVVRQSVLATGLVDNKVCAIDSTWSALRFAARRT